MMTHWANTYLHPHIAYRAGGQTRESGFDCWSFVRHVQREHFGVILPDVPHDLAESGPLAILRTFRKSSISRLVTPVTTPSEGDVVQMMHRTAPCHVGIWIEADRGGVLHCCRSSGVQFIRRISIPASGWMVHSFMRPIRSAL